MNINVSFQMAKLLKEKEYLVTTRSIHYFEKSLCSGSYMYNPKGVLELCNMPLVGLKTGWVDAPTISDIVMWLKEKHGVWIFAETDCYGENWYGKISICSKDVWDDTELRSKIVALRHTLNHNEHKAPSPAYEEVISAFLTTVV